MFVTETVVPGLEEILLAQQWAEHAYLRSTRTCQDRECASYSVEEALLMCMFYIWIEEYGPGWESAIEEVA